MSLCDNSLVLMALSSECRSISPMTPSPSREMRGIRLFRAISRKLARHRRTRRNQENFEEDSRSSSTDSCSSTSAGRRCSQTGKKTITEDGLSSAESGFRSVSPHHMSSSSSDAGSDSSKNNSRHQHSTSAESIRKVFINLSLNSSNTGRSKSCSTGKETSTSKRAAVKAPPKKILRPPVSYTYVKGLSGLPTQRVPKNLPRVYMNSTCGCNMQYIAALNR